MMICALPITGGFTAHVDAEDFDRCSAFHWRAIIARRKDGSIRTVYAARNQKRAGKQKTIYLHRFILGVLDPTIEVDHRDTNGLNCVRSNMRTATRSQNQWNMQPHRNTATGFKGVDYHKPSGLWSAKIQVNGKRRSLGYHKSASLAAAAYDDAAREAFGEYARTSTPPKQLTII
jgi:hypothetical protein